MTEAKFTTDHDEIREWAEARGGRPAAVRKTHGKDDPGIIRIEFPDAPNAKDAALEEITWEEFFEKFDEADLALVYQEETASGQKQFQQADRARNGGGARTRRQSRQPSSPPLNRQRRQTSTAQGLSPSAMSRDGESGVAADRRSSVVCTGSYRRSQPNDPVRRFSCVAPRISWHRPGGRCGRRAGGICPVQDLPQRPGRRPEPGRA
jgi:hypothetical protein